MKNKILIFALLLTITIPQVASAAWWNPFSWKVFGKVFSPKVEVLEDSKAIDQESNDNTSTATEESEIDKLRAEIEELKKSKGEEKSKPKPASNDSQPAVKPTISKPATVSPTVQTQSNTAVTFEYVVKKYTDFLSLITSERSGLEKNSSLSIERTYFNFLDEILNKINSDLGYLESIKYWNPRPSAIENVYLEKYNKLKDEYNIQSRSYNADIKAEQQKNYYTDALIRLNSTISQGESFKEWLNDTNDQLRSSIMLIANKPLNVGLIGECRSASIDLGNSLREYVSSTTFSVQENITKWKILRDYFNSNPSEFVDKDDLDLIPTLDSIKDDYSIIRNKINENLNSVTDGMKC